MFLPENLLCLDHACSDPLNLLNAHFIFFMVLPFPSLSFFPIPVTLFLKQSFKFLTVCDTVFR